MYQAFQKQHPMKYTRGAMIVTGEHLPIIQQECAKHLPQEFLPEFSVAEDQGKHYYLEGMYHLAKEIKAESI